MKVLELLKTYISTSIPDDIFRVEHIKSSLCLKVENVIKLTTDYSQSAC